MAGNKNTRYVAKHPRGKYIHRLTWYGNRVYLRINVQERYPAVPYKTRAAIPVDIPPKNPFGTENSYWFPTKMANKFRNTKNWSLYADQKRYTDPVPMMRNRITPNKSRILIFFSISQYYTQLAIVHNTQGVIHRLGTTRLFIYW